MRMLLLAVKDILKKAHYNTENLPSAIEKELIILKKVQENSSNGALYNLIKNALGNI